MMTTRLPTSTISTSFSTASFTISGVISPNPVIMRASSRKNSTRMIPSAAIRPRYSGAISQRLAVSVAAISRSTVRNIDVAYRSVPRLSTGAHGSAAGLDQGCFRFSAAAHSDIVERSHHSGFLMVGVVAVAGPSPGNVRVARDRHARPRRHHDRVAARAGKAAAVDRDDLEDGPGQVHRMRHHRRVLHHQFDALAGDD